MGKPNWLVGVFQPLSRMEFIPLPYLFRVNGMNSVLRTVIRFKDKTTIQGENDLIIALFPEIDRIQYSR